jgi:hypothetical protein
MRCCACREGHDEEVRRLEECTLWGFALGTQRGALLHLIVAAALS